MVIIVTNAIYDHRNIVGKTVVFIVISNINNSIDGECLHWLMVMMVNLHGICV